MVEEVCDALCVVGPLCDVELFGGVGGVGAGVGGVECGGVAVVGEEGEEVDGPDAVRGQEGAEVGEGGGDVVVGENGEEAGEATVPLGALTGVWYDGRRGWWRRDGQCGWCGR